tara:strand:+ start:11185 stop:11340 length:156 start_codon:yes stop_codon:yes gene_type:complete
MLNSSEAGLKTFRIYLVDSYQFAKLATKNKKRKNDIKKKMVPPGRLELPRP